MVLNIEVSALAGDLRQAVMLPEGEDLNEWVAVNCKSLLLQFFNMKKLRLNAVLYFFCCSCRFFQPNKYAIWNHHRVLYG